VKALKLSRDAKFLEKLTDVSQIQALDRTQRGLPLKKGRCGTMTHDYKRNGTLFAALEFLALRQAIDRGLIARQPIRHAQLNGPARKIVEEVLRQAA
jgi:hypothetical protein